MHIYVINLRKYFYKIITTFLVFCSCSLQSDTISNSQQQVATNATVQEQTNIAQMEQKLTHLETKLDKIANLIEKQHAPQQPTVEPEKIEIHKHKVFLGNIKTTIFRIINTLQKSITFVFTNHDTRSIFKTSTPDISRLILSSALIAYLLFFTLKKLLHYHQAIYSSYWHEIFDQFSQSIFLSIFLFLFYSIPELEIGFIIKKLNAFSTNETKFLIVVITKIVTSVTIIKAITALQSYITTNKIAKNIMQYITKAVTLICITWSLGEILKHLIAIHEINNIQAKIMDDINASVNFFYTFIMMYILISIRSNIQNKFKTNNVWVRNLTGLHSIILVLLYIIVMFWVNMNVPYKLLRVIVSVALFPSILSLSIILRKCLIQQVGKFDTEYKKHVISIYVTLLKVIKKSVIPVVIFLTLTIWNISVYKNIAMFIRPTLLDKLLSLTYLCILYYIMIVVSKHILAGWINNKIQKNREEDERKFYILFQIFLSVARVISGIVLFIGSLSIIGFNTSQIIPALGILSAGLSLSVRDIIADLLNGVFIIIENTIMVGDMIVIENKNARVEDMTLRYMQVRRDDGTLITVPYHKVNEVFNKSRKFMSVFINMAVKYDTKMEDVTKTIEEAYNILRETSQFKHKVYIPLEIRGMSEITGSYYTVFAKFNVKPGFQFHIERELHKILKELCDQKGIQPPKNIVVSNLRSPSFKTKLPESIL